MLQYAIHDVVVCQKKKPKNFIYSCGQKLRATPRNFDLDDKSDI